MDVERGRGLGREVGHADVDQRRREVEQRRRAVEHCIKTALAAATAILVLAEEDPAVAAVRVEGAARNRHRDGARARPPDAREREEAALVVGDPAAEGAVRPEHDPDAVGLLVPVGVEGEGEQVALVLQQARLDGGVGPDGVRERPVGRPRVTDGCDVELALRSRPSSMLPSSRRGPDPPTRGTRRATPGRWRGSYVLSDASHVAERTRLLCALLDGRPEAFEKAYAPLTI